MASSQGFEDLLLPWAEALHLHHSQHLYWTWGAQWLCSTSCIESLCCLGTLWLQRGWNWVLKRPSQCSHAHPDNAINIPDYCRQWNAQTSPGSAYLAFGRHCFPAPCFVIFLVYQRNNPELWRSQYCQNSGCGPNVLMSHATFLN